MNDNDFDFKELENMDEKEEKEEKQYDEKYRRDPLSSIVWAFILIWAGCVLLLDNLGYLDSLEIGPFGNLPFELPFSIGPWQLIFIGAGVIVLLEVVVRTVIPTYRRPIIGTLIFAGILLGIGLGNWNLIWAAVLIVGGLSLLLRNIRGQ
jgi:hypothetical protein